jgi:hypothetical protein
LDGARKVAPFSVLPGEGAMTYLCQLIDATAAPVDFRPAAGQQSAPLQPVQCRVDTFTAGTMETPDRAGRLMAITDDVIRANALPL